MEMFVENPSAELRQGDVLEPLYYVSPSFHLVRDGKLTLPQSCTLRHARLAIISQCCELQWYTDKNGQARPKSPWVLVAPLSLKMPFQRGTSEYQKMVENGENQPENDPVRYFYFQDNPLVGCESVIDFSTVIPMKSSELREFSPRKALELNVKYRHLLRNRLMEFFGRIPDEDWEEVATLFPTKAAK